MTKQEKINEIFSLVCDYGEECEYGPDPSKVIARILERLEEYIQE